MKLALAEECGASQPYMNIQDSFLICQKKPSRWFFNLRHTLPFGIGLHHAGLNEKDRYLVEELFANNKIQVLVCTSTLAWGVNLPGHHLIIIKGTEYYDGKTRRDVDFPISITDILQMMVLVTHDHME
ncbi:hypothetical protein L3X38_008618 [Prunus dulcis]|uniref:Helicase C-terminal domain-containing protein n=1 Tax=Prunus dulcis TaxID=3755 RepID=A0AAD4ZX47_PRUDU|nr:hypothetical protein L3X38_008618 [Prunus dulcis]